jgi:uncharacterized membrane protein (DUF4010 family)
LLGVVRERRPQADKSKAGLRTHALVSILGCVAWGLGPWPFTATVLAVGALVYSGYRATAPTDPGLTGEIAVLVTLMLSALVHSNAAMAVGLGVLVATLLEFKQVSHRFTREWITQQELQDTLVLAVAALVVMPLLPSQAVDPWNVLRPTTLWRIVVLVMAVGMLGHLAQRLLGLRWGLPIAGFCSGFVSSTAALAHLGHKVREDAQLIHSASAAALLSNLASLLLMMAVIGAVSPDLLRAVAWPLGAAGLGLLAVALLCLHKRAPLATSSIQLTDSAFKLSHALLLALVVGGVSLLSAGLQAWWGHTGALLTAMLVAMVEIHAAAASLAQLSLASDMPMNLVTWSLVAVLASSAMAKTLLAFISGGAGFGWRVALGLAAMVTGASLTLLLQAA